MYIIHRSNHKKERDRNQDLVLLKVKYNSTTFGRYIYSTIVIRLHSNQEGGLQFIHLNIKITFSQILGSLQTGLRR